MKYNKIFIIVALMFTFFACSEDIMDDINKNPNNPTAVASKFILTDVMTSTAFNITGSDYAFYSAVYMELHTGIWGQMYNAEIRSGEPVSSTTYNNVWNAQYRNLYQLKIVMDKCKEGGNEAGNYQNLGIAQVLSAYNLAMLTDVMGDAPWTEAMQPGIIYQPKLDKQETLYNQVFTYLDEAIANFDKATTFPSIGTQDPMYSGSSAKWKKAALGLKARYTMRLSLKKADYQKVIDFANAAFTTSADELKFKWGTNTVNPFARFLQDRNYFGASQSLNVKLTARNDPRKAKFWKTPTGVSSIIYAPNGAPEQKQNSYALSALSSNSNPTYFQSYHELEFLKAEAYARLSQKDNAETALKKAISAAFVKVGLTAAEADAYYTASVKALFDANPLSEIMNQKYLAAYEDEGLEAYNDYRRLKAMGNDVITLVNTNQFPQRFTYGSSDVTTNPNIRDAYGDGSYVYTEKVWWAGGTR